MGFPLLSLPYLFRQSTVPPIRALQIRRDGSPQQAGMTRFGNSPASGRGRFRSLLNRLAAILEELNQQSAGRFGADAAIDLGTMMAGRPMKEARAMFDRAHLFIRRPKV
jgi:hypothetical protein